MKKSIKMMMTIIIIMVILRVSMIHMMKVRKYRDDYGVLLDN